MSAPPNIPRALASEQSVSVVVPSYNHARFIEKCLRSIFRQELQPAKLVVIDDGSTDESPRIIERLLNECPFPSELIARTNRGLSATLNEGLTKTNGEYFAYLGSDDLWLPQFLSARTETLKTRRDAVLAYGHAYSINESDQIIDCTVDWAKYVDGDVRRMLLSTLAPLSPTVVYRRTAVKKYGWNENAQLEDYELYLRLSADGDFAFDPRILSGWRQHETNVSSNVELMFDERMQAQQRACSELKVDSSELNHYQRLATFRSAQELMRVGEKRRALQLWRSGGSAASTIEVMRMVVGLVTPLSVIKSRRSRRRQEAIERYGSVQI